MRLVVASLALLSAFVCPLFAIDNLKLNPHLDYTSDSLDGALITGDDAQSGFVSGQPNYVIIYAEGCFNSKRQARRTVDLYNKYRSKVHFVAVDLNVPLSSEQQKLVHQYYKGAIDKLSALGFTCGFIENEQTLLWSKLVFLGPLALGTTAANKTAGDIASDGFWNRQVQDCVREACAVATAEGATVNADTVLSSIASLPPGTRSSMQKDVERGNAPELDAIAGPILRAAARHGLKVPVKAKLAADVKQRAVPSS